MLLVLSKMRLKPRQIGIVQCKMDYANYRLFG
ncbi:hypothetical protein DFP86_10376 [Paludibacterium purpuratum]|uniref:Uncharacterized protein n=1 Tax=Paludibacterium purpuratum TaxID=1144873 RepID=A0A4R7BA24_9NEIS|nr:hypothetical protein DFP86_10376 [Paludibacterium purpuratum]